MSNLYFPFDFMTKDKSGFNCSGSAKAGFVETEIILSASPANTKVNQTLKSPAPPGDNSLRANFNGLVRMLVLAVIGVFAITIGVLYVELATKKYCDAYYL